MLYDQPRCRIDLSYLLYKAIFLLRDVLSDPILCGLPGFVNLSIEPGTHLSGGYYRAHQGTAKSHDQPGLFSAVDT